MSPTEAFREQVLELLADPLTGLNPEFVDQCGQRNLPVPAPAQGGSDAAPFNFGPNSGNVFTVKAPLSFLEENGEVGYPNLNIYGMSVTEIRDGTQIMGMKASVIVQLEIVSYLAWIQEQTPPNNNFEAYLDALEESFYNVINRDSRSWFSPVLYSNDLNVRERFPLAWANAHKIIRNGLRLGLSARYQMA